MLSFDDYPDISARLDAVLAGEPLPAHAPRDRRELLPLTPVARQAQRCGRCPGTPLRPAPAAVAGRDADEHTPAHLRGCCAIGWTPARSLRSSWPAAATGAARSAPSPPSAAPSSPATPDELLAEAEWLAATGVRELVLVSENSTSYGKDLGDPRALEKLLPQLAAIDGIVRVRASYLQPAETRPGLVEVIATTPGRRPYFDLSFQHSSEPVLRRMRRFGSTDRFLELLDSPARWPRRPATAATSSSASPARPGPDVDELVRFLTEARLDAIGVFDYSDEDGTEAAGLPGKVPQATIKRRYDQTQRARRRAVLPAGRGAARLAGRGAGRLRCRRRVRAGPRTRRPR